MSHIRCLNCQEPVFLDESLRERYPEWETLTASQKGRLVSAEKRERSGSGGRKDVAKLAHSSSSSGGGENFATVPSCSGESVGGNLGHRLAMEGNLFDIICNDQTPLDHPMCQECTDKLLDCMDQQLKNLEEESADYSKLLENLKRRQNTLDLNRLRVEHGKLQSEEAALRAELARLESEEEEIDRQLDAEKLELEQVKKEEERLWKVSRDYSRHLLDLEQEEQSVQAQLRYTMEQLDKLSKTNIFNLTFHIWHSGHFGMINGFRLGRLPDVQVDWNEINAAWGQVVLLLSCLARKLKFSFKGYELVPLGNFSCIRVAPSPPDTGEKDEGKGKEGGRKEFPLHFTGGYKFLGSPKFDAGMVAFLDCLQQLNREIDRIKSFKWPHEMAKDKIFDSGREYSVKIQFNSEERWTKAMKCMLTNLKWALAWIVSLEP